MHNVCAVPWGLCSTVGVFSTIWDTMMDVEDILTTVGMFSTVGNNMSTVRVIMSTATYLDYVITQVILSTLSRY